MPPFSEVVMAHFYEPQNSPPAALLRGAGGGGPAGGPRPGGLPGGGSGGSAAAAPREAPARRFPYAPVRTLMLYLTLECNLRCPYCFVVKEPRRMTSETARRAVDVFLSRPVSGREYTVGINLFGGEPFLEPERMAEVVEYARRSRPNNARRVLFSATTNGTLYSERIGALVRDAGMAILVSLDGSPEVTAADRPFLSGRSSCEFLPSMSWTPTTGWWGRP